MKCKKYDQAWFNNQYVQLLNQICPSQKKLQRLSAFMKLAKKHKIVPVATLNKKNKVIRQDYGTTMTTRAIRARKARLKRKKNQRHMP